jgi:hypothetical protein
VSEGGGRQRAAATTHKHHQESVTHTRGRETGGVGPRAYEHKGGEWVVARERVSSANRKTQKRPNRKRATRTHTHASKQAIKQGAMVGQAGGATGKADAVKETGNTP